MRRLNVSAAGRTDLGAKVLVLVLPVVLLVLVLPVVLLVVSSLVLQLPMLLAPEVAS